MEHEHREHVGPYAIHSIASGSGAPLVFLHGWSQHAGSSRHIRDMLAHKYTVISPSHLGFGKSSALPRHGFSIADYGQVYMTWLMQRHLTNVTLIGHSFGGAIAIVVAAMAPVGMVKRVILIDALGVRYQRSGTSWAWQWLLKEVGNLLDAPKKQAQLLTAPFFQHAVTRPRNLISLSTLSTTLDVQAYAKQIRVPTDILWGDADTFVPRSVGEQLHKCIPNSTLTVIPGGHDWPLLHPERLLPYVH